ncbi:MAG: hypothetical protein LBG74_00715, partial [Spirochaetaceae bacterium]|nr:hypothetical protein [Spirochaetaceae bacterium]
YFESPTWAFERLDRGLTAKFALTIPDIFFVSTSYSQSLSAYVDNPGNRTLHLFEARIGFWLYHILASINIERHENVMSESIALRKTLSRNKVFGRFEFYAKNVPLMVSLDGGVMILAGVFENIVLKITQDETFAVYGGFRLSFDFSKNVRWYIGGEVPAALNGALATFMFKAETGFKFTIRPE